MNESPPVSDFDLDAFLPYRLAVAAARVSRRFAERYRAEFGISIAEWRVLAHLSQQDAVSVREIRARVDLDKSQVSRAAARLESVGLVEKRAHPGDGRLLELRMTAAGRALFARIAPVARTYQTELRAALGPDADAFGRGLDRILGMDE